MTDKCWPSFAVFPNHGGLQDVGKSDMCTFDEQIGDFVQVLNCYSCVKEELQNQPS